MNLRPLIRLWLPKAGNSPDEYEDAFRTCYPVQLDEAEACAARMAVSDGATESAFAGEWANALASAFVTRPLDLGTLTEGSLSSWLNQAQTEWRDRVPWGRIPWHGEAKARAGAFATLLGVTFRAAPENPGRLCWQAMAIGDSCLFLIRDDRLHTSFPLENPDQFDNHPPLVCSNSAGTAGLWDRVRHISGECATGDLFLLASDALARWFLADIAAGEKPWETLMAFQDDNWAEWAAELRNKGSMGNDDMTLLTTAVV